MNHINYIFTSNNSIGHHTGVKDRKFHVCLLSEFKCQFMCACYLYIHDVNLSTRTPLVTLRSRSGNIGVLYKTLTYNYEVIALHVLFFPTRYYADIRQTISASDQEMNSSLAEISRVGPCFWKNKFQTIK